MIRRAVFGACAAAFLICVAGCGGTDGGRSGPRPHLVLITIDCLRTDAVASYGGAPGITPNLESLANGGVVFEHAWAPMATTHPSHSTMLTGLYPRYHGVRWNGDQLPEDVTTVTQWLSDAGYQTGAFVAYKAMLFRAGLNRGFDTASDKKKERGKAHIRRGEEVIRQAVNWLSTVDADEPVFLWVHLFEAHSPFEMTEYARERLGEYDGLLAQGSLSVDEMREHKKEILASERDTQALRVLYDGEVHESDKRIGELLGSLDRHGILLNAVVLATGDHGQSLGEGGWIGHGARLEENLMRVPLLMKDFRGSEFAEIRVPTAVGLVDIAPTLIELAGERVPKGLQGRSLAATLGGEEPAPGVYFAEVNVKMGRGQRRIEDPPPDMEKAAAYLWPYKLTQDAHGLRVWQLNDTGEMEKPVRDIARLEDVRDRLLPFLEEFLGDQWDKPSHAALNEDELEELRSLGYLQ